MGFFNDLKEDLAFAVNELTDEKAEKELALSSEHIREDIAKIDNEKNKKNKKEKKSNANLEREIQNILNGIDENAPIETEVNNEEAVSGSDNENVNGSEQEEVENLTFEEANALNSQNVITIDLREKEPEETESNDVQDDNITINSEETVNTDSPETDKEETEMPEEEKTIKEENNTEDAFESADREIDDDDVTVISSRTTIKGPIETEGSIEIAGTVEGSVKASGEVIVNGSVTGDIEGLVISISSGKVRGNVKSYSGFYISDDSYVIGDIEATDAEIAGAVKGKIDVNGPVILQEKAKVLGDIDCKSVQINNGAVIEGKCSQKYSDISPSAFFENL
ncbi:MAG: polymer-forming cytoskeletal protein [Lachnospiraceae bacterium]|nr:polymer-forming cytoskeletal protein [Lachnospiraceae bacterium]